MGEKDVVDPVDAGLLQPVNEVGNGGRRTRIDEKRRPVDPVKPCADELPETLEGAVEVDQVQIVTDVMNGHRLSF
jgi:hypothetical protein